jgi:hypothetical protein
MEEFRLDFSIGRYLDLYRDLGRAEGQGSRVEG